jgi:hypothetical protein
MRFNLRFISFVLLTALPSLVPIPVMLAQAIQPRPAATATEDPAGANKPQYPDSLSESGAQQPASGLNQNADPQNGQSNGARQSTSVNDPATAKIGGTVTDVYGDVVQGATVVLGDAASERQTVISNGTGAFQFDHLKPGTPYHITVEAKGFESWKSPTVILNPGQYFYVQDIKLKFPVLVASVTVYSSPEQIATQQVILQEHQRVLGFLPNFYVTYAKNPAPLTTKLKFRLAYKANTDVVTFAGVAFLASIYQAADILDYGQGWDAYGKRVAAGYADSTTDIFIGGAILPSLLHQDPRYFYQGTGTNRSRAFHAVFSPFICRGDNGKQQPNYSTIGGDLASGAISNLYYPQSNRGAGLVFQGFAVTTGVRIINGVLQEFVLRKLTPSARQQN